jgi:hypothetical protein
MAQDLREAVEAWKQANQEAKVAEHLLAAEWDGYHAGTGPAVNDALVQAVSELRGVANDKLTVALAVMQASRAK